MGGNEANGYHHNDIKQKGSQGPGTGLNTKNVHFDLPLLRVRIKAKRIIAAGKINRAKMVANIADLLYFKPNKISQRQAAWQ